MFAVSKVHSFQIILLPVMFGHVPVLLVGLTHPHVSFYPSHVLILEIKSTNYIIPTDAQANVKRATKKINHHKVALFEFICAYFFTCQLVTLICHKTVYMCTAINGMFTNRVSICMSWNACVAYTPRRVSNTDKLSFGSDDLEYLDFQ